MKKKVLLTLGCLVLIAAVATGCARTKATPTPTPLPSPTTTLGTTPPGVINTPQVTGATDGPGTSPTTGVGGIGADAEMSKQVTTEVEKLSEIQTAYALVKDTQAIIAVEFTNEYKGELDARLEGMLLERAQAADSKITEVKATNNATLVSQIKTEYDMLQGTTPGSSTMTWDELMNSFTK